MDAYLQKLFKYIVPDWTVIPEWMPPVLAGLGVLLILAATVLYLLPESFRAGLTADYQCFTARRVDLESIYLMARDHFGDAVSSVATMKRWHDKNRDIFSILYRVRRRKFAETKEMVGYFCIIPITQDAATRMIDGEIRAAQLLPTDIVTSDVPCAAMFIGAVVGTTAKARGNILSLLHREVMTHRARWCDEFLTRPVTTDGLRIVEKFGFLPRDSSSTGGLDVLYSFKPRQ